MMLRKIALSLFFVTSSISVAFACGDGATAEDPAPAKEPVAAAAPAPASPASPAQPARKAAPSAGAVSGTVSFEGKAPEPKDIDLSSDPFCVDAHSDGFRRSSVVVSGRGGLADVFVQLTGVPDERYSAPDEPVVLDQIGCSYAPHVFGIVKKQDIEILNSDDTLHNIHAVPDSNKEFNVGMPTKGMRVKKTFKKAEDAIRIKCDVHPWMAAYCFSMEHPYFGTTDADGKFSIDTTDLPDGKYGVKFWHEELGEREGSVTVESGAATLDFSYSASS